MKMILMDCRRAPGSETDELHRRHCRPAQCRQVDAVQPAGRPAAGAGRRPAGRDARPPRRRGRLGDIEFTVIDTAGLEQSAPESLSGRMRAQTETAIEQADAIFFMIDARAGPTPADHDFADAGAQIRQTDRSDRQQERRHGRRSAAGWKPMRSASASRSRFRPSTTRACPISTTRCAPRCRTKPRPRRMRPPRRVRGRIRSASPSSAVPTPANRR